MPSRFRGDLTPSSEQSCWSLLLSLCFRGASRGSEALGSIPKVTGRGRGSWTHPLPHPLPHPQHCCPLMLTPPV